MQPLASWHITTRAAEQWPEPKQHPALPLETSRFTEQNDGTKNPEQIANLQKAGLNTVKYN